MLFQNKGKEKEKIPTCVEDFIPLLDSCEDGIFLVGRNLWSKTFTFTDRNYALVSKEEKEELFLRYSEILNALDSKAKSKITILQRNVTEKEMGEHLLKEKKDGFDEYRKAYNQMVKKQGGLDGMIQERYLTITVEKKNYEEAAAYFQRVYAEFSSLFSKLGSHMVEVREEDRLRLFYQIYHGNDLDFLFQRELYEKRRNGYRNAISPESMELYADYMKFDERFARVLYLKDYANYIKDDFLMDLADGAKNLCISLDLSPIPVEDAIRQGENKLLSIETNITNWQRRQNNHKNYAAEIPFDMEKQRIESKEFLNDLVSRDQRMIPTLITMLVMEDNKQNLDNATEAIRLCARKHMCSFVPLRFQQKEGILNCLPYGVTPLSIRRTLTTESLAVFLPFRSQNIRQKDGIYFGKNSLTNTPIFVDENALQNGNSFILGVSGSGKSMFAKEQISAVWLNDPTADILVIDPEGEYTELCKAFQGQTIILSSGSSHGINPMDMPENYLDMENPISQKSEFLTSLCEEMVGELSPLQKSLIHRCCENIYKPYLEKGTFSKSPTLEDFAKELSLQEEPEGKRLALSLEIFTKGNVSAFANETNIGENNRFVTYDISSLGKQWMSIGMLSLLDIIWNRILWNKKTGRKTYIYLDEIYLLFSHEYTSNFLFSLWKRVRKYNAFIIGMTQNVEDLLESRIARSMLANSELLVLLNQAPTDRLQLSQLLSLSADESKYLCGANVGEGLLKVGNSLVPFQNRMGKESLLYALCSTDRKICQEK